MALCCQVLSFGLMKGELKVKKIKWSQPYCSNKACSHLCALQQTMTEE